MKQKRKKRQPQRMPRKLSNIIFVNVGMVKAFIKAVVSAQEYCEFLDATKTHSLWKKSIHNKMDRLYKRMRRNTSTALAKAKE